MKIRKFRLIIFALAFCLCATAAGIFLSGGLVAEADADVEVEIAEKYSVGDKFEIPDGLKMQVDSKEYAVTNTYVIFPDGTAYSSKSVVLSEAGKYEAVFESAVDGKNVSVRKNFRAINDMFSFENEKSAVSYGKLNDNWADAYKNGLKVSLAESDTMKYAKPLNLYESDVTDIIAMNVMQKDVVADVGQVIIRLTDVYDPSVYIEIVYKSDPLANVNFLRASANGGSSIGLNTGTAGDGVTVRGRNLVKDRNGTSVAANWYEGKVEYAKEHGQAWDNLNPTWNNFTVYFDNTVPERPCISVRQGREYNKTDAAIDKYVAEFNNSDLFSYEFGGFTTGEVLLTMSASSFGNGTTLAPIEIGYIGGEYGERLDVVEYEDVTPPTISLDLPENGVKIYAGCPVTVPVPAVYDAGGVKGGAVDYSVWFRKNSSSPKRVSVKNGVFTPEKVGDYSIVYTATDLSGNVSEKRIDLYAASVAEDGKLGIDLDYTKTGSRNAGDALSFGEVSAVSLNGRAKVEIRITTPAGETEIANRSEDYILRSVGNYKIEYVCSDIIYRCVYTDEFVAADAGQYGFDAKKIIMPEYVIKGASYSFDNVNLVKYTAGGNLAAEYDAYMISDGGSPVKCDATEVVIAANDTVRFRLVAKDDPAKIIESDELKVADVNYTVKNNLNFAKYFVGGYDGEKAEGKTYAVFKRNGKENSSLDFINPLVTQYFSFSFEIPSGTADYSITLRLRGYNDRENVVELKLGEDADGCYLETRGTVTRVSGKLSGSSTEVRYSTENNETYLYVVNRNGVDERIKSDAVTDDLCLFGTETSGADEFYVYQVCNQSFSSVNNFDDKTDPYLIVEEAEPVADFGSSFTTSVPVYGDVLTPTVAKNCVLSIYFGDDVYTAKDGTEFLNVRANRVYEITFDKYGEYVFIYSYTDGKGNSVTAPFAINVIDDVPPVVAIDGKTNIEAKVGETVKPLAYTISDNCSDKENITVSVIVYNARGMLVTASRIDGRTDGSYTFNKAGKYTVYLYCRDEAGNNAFVTYTITVR